VRNFPAWREHEGNPQSIWYAVWNCGLGFMAESRYRAAYGDTTFRAYADSCRSFYLENPLSPVGFRGNFVTGQSSGMAYAYALETDDAPLRDSALARGARVRDWIEEDAAARLAVGDWAITSTKIVDITPLGGAEIANWAAEPFHGVAFAGDEVVTADPDGVVRAVAISPGGDLPSRLVGDVASIRPGFVLDDARQQVAVLVDDRDGRIEVRDAATGDVLREHDLGDGSFVETMAWHPDGRHLAYAQSTDDWTNSEIVVIDGAGTIVASKELDGLFVSAVSFSWDGSRLAWNQSRRLRADPLVDAIAIWDWRTAEDVGRIEASVTNVEFDPTGRFLAATRFNDGRAEVFDANTYEPIATLSGSTTQHLELAFSADGSQLATAGADGVIRIWDPLTGEEQMTLRTPKAARYVAFDETGERLASLDGSGVARVWALDLDTLVEIAQRRLTRALTIEECERYLLSNCPG
jgi:DNA-binding beta-propeller fold protein YncE